MFQLILQTFYGENKCYLKTRITNHIMFLNISKGNSPNKHDFNRIQRNCLQNLEIKNINV